MSTTEKQNDEFLETLKSNYKKRIQETDNFSRNFSNSSADFRSQYLTGLLDLLQHYLDLQKKFTKDYPLWYDTGLMSKQSKMITESWVNTMRNMDSFYNLLLEYGTKNLRIFNQAMMQMMQMTEMYRDMREKIPMIPRNKLVEIIKEVKENNDKFMQKQLPKKGVLSNKESQKKKVVARQT